MFQPAIKWSGSKRPQSNDIISHFPERIKTYYEPFCGGCSVTRTLIESNIRTERIVCSDLNRDLISLWQKIKEDYESISKAYALMWNEMNLLPTQEEKRFYYEGVREKFNSTRDPHLFMFIMRTTTNGMPRYNSKGEFNNSFHITRNGIAPERLSGILKEWSELLNKANVEFVCQSYDAITPEKDDFVYMDPPYGNSDGMYFGKFDKNRFFGYVKNLDCPCAVSYHDKEYVPEGIFDKEIRIMSGNSSFRRIITGERDSVIYEKLYTKGYGL